MNLKAGRVTPCAPSLYFAKPGAHGVTRPTTATWFRGSRREKMFRRILTPAVSPQDGGKSSAVAGVFGTLPRTKVRD